MHTHTVYILKIFTCIQNVYIYITDKYIELINIIYFLNVYMYTCMCVYLYRHNKYTQYTHIYYVNKTFILDMINHD